MRGRSGGLTVLLLGAVLTLLALSNLLLLVPAVQAGPARQERPTVDPGRPTLEPTLEPTDEDDEDDEQAAPTVVAPFPTGAVLPTATIDTPTATAPLIASPLPSELPATATVVLPRPAVLPATGAPVQSWVALTLLALASLMVGMLLLTAKGQSS